MNKMIFIVEDDDNIREMIKMALTSFSYEVSAFDNAEDALAAVYNASRFKVPGYPSESGSSGNGVGSYKTLPDMIIFDIMLPGMSGLEAVKKLRNKPETKDVPIIILTAKDTEFDKVKGLDCGADDYIAKPFGVMELGARVRSLLRRTGKNDELPAEDIAISDLKINKNTREITQNGKLLDLTFKEYELLCVLIRESDRIVPRDELLNMVWGFQFVGESRTLDIHIRNLRQKLSDDAENPKYIKTVRNVGYRFIAI